MARQSVKVFARWWNRHRQSRLHEQVTPPSALSASVVAPLLFRRRGRCPHCRHRARRCRRRTARGGRGRSVAPASRSRGICSVGRGRGPHRRAQRAGGRRGGRSRRPCRTPVRRTSRDGTAVGLVVLGMFRRRVGELSCHHGAGPGGARRSDRDQPDRSRRPGDRAGQICGDHTVSGEVAALVVQPAQRRQRHSDIQVDLERTEAGPGSFGRASRSMASPHCRRARRGACVGASVSTCVERARCPGSAAVSPGLVREL